MQKILVLLLLLTMTPISFPADAQECPPSRLVVGEMGRNTAYFQISLFAEPSSDASTLEDLQYGSSYTVLDESQCIDGRLWIKVQTYNFTGWIAEISGDQYLTEPFMCESHLKIGDEIEVIYYLGTYIYSEPSQNSSIISHVEYEQFITIVDGPWCNEFVVWMKIEFEGQTGWIQVMGDDVEGNTGIIAYARRPVVELPPVKPQPFTPSLLSLPANTITPANATKLENLKIIGGGYLAGYTWKPDESQIAIAGSLDIQIFDPYYLSENSSVLRVDDFTLTSLIYSPDGQYIATSNQQGTVVVRDSQTYEPLYSLQHDNTPLGIQFSPDGQYIAVQTNRNGVSLWSLIGDNPQETQFETGEFPSIKFSQNGNMLIIGTSVRLQVIDIETKTIILDELVSPPAEIVSWDFWSSAELITMLIEERYGEPPFGHLYYEYNIKLRTSEKSLVTELTRDDRSAYPNLSITVAPDESSYVINFGEKQQYTNIAAEGGLYEELNIPNVTHVAYSPDSQLIAFATSNGIHLYRQNTFLAILPIENRSVFNISFSPKGRFITVMGRDNNLNVWNVETRQHLGTIAFERFGYNMVLIDDTTIGSSGKIWDLNTGAVVGKDEKHDDAGNPTSEVVDTQQFASYPIGVSPDGQIAAYVRENNDLTDTIVVLKLETGEIIQEFERYFESVHTLTISPDNRTLLVDAIQLSNRTDAGKFLWDIEGGSLIAELPLADISLYQSVFSGDGAKIAWDSKIDDRWYIVIYDRQTEETILISDVPEKMQLKFALNPSGTVLALGNADASISLYDTATGELITTLSGQKISIGEIKFSPDGIYLYTSSTDGTLRVWGLDE